MGGAFAGSPFDAVEFEGRTIEIGQAGLLATAPRESFLVNE